MTVDMDYMEQALSLAKLALGQVSPNPAVGAVLVKDDVVVGQGFTRPPGSAHAEIMALKQAGDLARGSIMYVTLEPCCHYGRTPPCTRAIVLAGVAEVHMAIIDANPLVCGKGLAELKQAGVKTCLGEHEAEANEVMEAYTKFISTGVPFVTAKFAMSLDGKIAAKSGDSRWITSELARQEVHRLRYTSDAILVGVNTVLADDPRLTVRCCGSGGVPKKQPLRVVVDSRGRTPLTAQVFKEPGKTVVAVTRSLTQKRRSGFAKAGAEVVELPSSEGGVDLAKLFKTLGEREVTSVLVEGGSTLLGSMFDAKLVDKVVAFIAPIIIGGEKAKTAVGGIGVDKIADSLRLSRVSTKRFGDDVMVSGYVGS